ncbi:cytochrome oxidase biogenesis protein [Vibrio lentus]|uniref:SURF1-like protein n=1 Tax=Vibrio lentus TaxID=136468 RepID=A0A1B9QE13_9VIBR|nr:cytochrome oxidase biogenesis protein [Vibrio lentus]PME55521.1 cytochrome oxidase biogenesis protein [Vibrio lentus]PME57963.1 cytochrome oxidase biogenesis protein [Vibrio lentus]PME94598.1 cytochrome oxidase biogenesis protein [Vibrio lentus]PMG64209.1 cytochrome oxidase biogenesis protein [Vibrio lentus]
MITPNRLIDDEHKFRSKGFWVAVVLTVVSVGILIKLGLWQLDRGNEKLSYEQQLLQRAQQSPKDLELVVSDWQRGNTQAQVDLTRQIWNGQKVNITLAAQSGLVFLLDNQINQGVVGYVIYMLGNIQSQGAEKRILIDLGFVAASNDRRELPKLGDIVLPTTMSGRLYTRSINPLSQTLGLEETTPKRIQNLNIEELSQYTKKEVMPFVFQPQNLEPWPYEFLWRPTAMKSEKHFGYSVQWFVMAGVLLFLMVLIGYRYMKGTPKVGD